MQRVEPAGAFHGSVISVTIVVAFQVADQDLSYPRGVIAGCL
ncbi:MAG: hypothetical protein R3E86_22125 [Pseudomonadales bacterium]